MSWYLNVLKNYAVFKGRARRKEFWMFYLVNLLICTGIAFIEEFTSSYPRENFIFSFVYMIIIFIPTLAVFVRRLHDCNKSGWWLLAGFIPLVGFSALVDFIPLIAFIPLSSIILLVDIILFIFLLKKGTDGDNKFGPNPKEQLNATS